MELTRRDALGALAAAGVVVGGAAVADRWDAIADAVDDGLGDVLDDDASEWDDHALETAVAVAEAVYPPAVENVPEFVGTYALSRSEDDPEYRRAMASAVDALDEHARHWEDAAFADLSRLAAQDALHSMDVDVAEPDPDGSPAERVRFYLVNELLYALYTTDTGGRLVGIENPQGHPGGTDSYQRGPNRTGSIDPPGEDGTQSDSPGETE